MGKYVVRMVALGYLLIILVGPLGMMIWRTFDDLGAAWAAITDHNTILAFKLTLLVTAIAVPINTVFGIVCGLVIVRKKFRGQGHLNAFVDLPLALSPVVVGLSLVLLYGANGWFGFLPEHGVQVLFAVPAIVIATIFVSLPFVAREVIPTLREIGDEQEQAAHTLGASGWQTFWRITLPSIKWAVDLRRRAHDRPLLRRVRRSRRRLGEHRGQDADRDAPRRRRLPVRATATTPPRTASRSCSR